MKRIIYYILAGLLLVPTVAQAYIPSPQYGAFELKFGPYKPNLDQEPGLKEQGAEPYRDTFGDDSMFLTVIELDWQIVHPPGFSLGIGGSVGFMQNYAKSTITDEAGNETDSADYTVLNIIPFALLAVIRIDALADELNVPIVPYFKAGLAWYVWWILGGGDTARFSVEGEGAETKGNGGTMGWQISPGIMFRLDQFDKISARTFDNEAGVNHSYLFAEILWAWVEGFGNDAHMYLSTDNFGGATFLAGIALEF